MDYQERSDEVLVAEARSAPAGDHRAFQVLVERHQEDLLADSRYLTGSPGDAEDLTQEVFVKIFFSLRSFAGRSQFKTWARRIKINHCLNFIRKRKGKSFLDVDAPEVQASEELHAPARGDAEAMRHDDREKIRAVLDSMSDTLRVPLILCDMDGLSYQEAADQLGIGLSALKMRLKRAREHFRSRHETGGREEGP